MKHQAKALLLIISALILLPGCLSWQQGWKQADMFSINHKQLDTGFCG